MIYRTKNKSGELFHKRYKHPSNISGMRMKQIAFDIIKKRQFLYHIEATNRYDNLKGSMVFSILING